jgi:hypothetical protein
MAAKKTQTRAPTILSTPSRRRGDGSGLVIAVSLVVIIASSAILGRTLIPDIAEASSAQMIAEKCETPIQIPVQPARSIDPITEEQPKAKEEERPARARDAQREERERPKKRARPKKPKAARIAGEVFLKGDEL